MALLARFRLGRNPLAACTRCTIVLPLKYSYMCVPLSSSSFYERTVAPRICNQDVKGTHSAEYIQKAAAGCEAHICETCTQFARGHCRQALQPCAVLCRAPGTRCLKAFKPYWWPVQALVRTCAMQYMAGAQVAPARSSPSKCCSVAEVWGLKVGMGSDRGVGENEQARGGEGGWQRAAPLSRSHSGSRRSMMIHGT